MGRLIRKRGKTFLSGPAENLEFYTVGEWLILNPTRKGIKGADPKRQFLIFCIICSNYRGNWEIPCIEWTTLHLLSANHIIHFYGENFIPK